MTQAMPLRNAEAPLVQSGITGEQDRSYEQEYGSHMGAVRSAKDGTVTKVTSDAIEVKYSDGSKETHELYQNFPMNRKSVTGDTQIWVKRAQQIWSTQIQDYAWQPGDETLSIDPDTKDSAWLTVSGYIKHTNDKQLLKVKLDSGREVTITEDHSLMVMGETGDLVAAYAGELVCGETRLPIAFPSITSEARRTEIDLGYLIGLFLACGGTEPGQPNLLHFGESVAEHKSQLRDLLRRLGGNPFNFGTTNTGCTMPEMAEFLRSNFGRLGKDRYIPNWVYQTHATFRAAIVSGYFAGNGCLWSDAKGAVQLVGASTSLALRDGIVRVLATLGVFATLMDMPRQYNNATWRDAFAFRVLSCHISRLPEWFFYTRRQAELESRLSEQYRNSVFEGIPIPNKAARRMLYAELPCLTNRIYKDASAGFIHKSRIAHIAGPFGDWARGDVLWDRVLSVTPVETQEFVYDLSVVASECFAVNGGIVVHNTFLHQTATVQLGQQFRSGDVAVHFHVETGVL